MSVLPKPQAIYVDVVTGTMGAFDSWHRWPSRGYYRTSAKAFVVIPTERIRAAMPAEMRLFSRASRGRVEASGILP